MSRNRWGAGLLAALLPLAVAAQTTAPGTKQDTAPAPPSGMAPAEAVPFAEPVLGANALTVGWKPSFAFPATSQAAPSLRLGVVWPRYFADLRLGLTTAFAPLDGFAGVSSLSLDAELGRCPYRYRDSHLCGVAGLGGGLLLGNSASSVGDYLAPTATLTLGVSVKHFVSPDFAVGLEGGARTQLGFFPDGYTDISTGLYLAFTGTFLEPWGWRLGTRARAQVPGPPVVTAPPPEEPPHAPSGTPPEYGTSSRPCIAYVTDGWFSPTQAVWQDDPSFEDKPRKQLTRRPGPDVIYDAELPMVKGKDALLFGVHHYRLGGQQVIVDSRDFIVLRGMTNCTVSVPVKMKFMLRNAAGSKPLYVSPTLAGIPLDGPPAPSFSPWELKLPVREGLPPDQPFTFELAVSHELTAELIRETGADTGLRMSVVTPTVETQGPVIHFVPVMLSPPKDDGEQSLRSLTELLVADSAQYIPDLFPLRAGGLPTEQKVIRNFIDQGIGSKWFEARRMDAVVAELNDSLASSAFLDGAGRVVAVMSGADFRSIFGSGAAGMTVGSSVTVTPRDPAGRRVEARTLSWKVMLVPFYESWDTVAHEVVHTLPEGWAAGEMAKECGRDYHNKKELLANGERITDGGAPAARERKAGMVPLMGPAVPLRDVWITQCTYSHLLQQLTGAPPDPPVLLVRALLSKEGGKVTGELRPLYELMGIVDVPAGKGGAYALLLRDARGAELGRYPLSPRWNDIEAGTPRSIVSMVFRVPALPEPAVVELVGPGGVLARKQMSATPPALRILTPAQGERARVENGRVRVTWRSESEPARKLLYTILYSSDGGQHFKTQAFELEADAFDVTIDPNAKDHRVKVVATDGTRSSEAVIPLKP